ncbi:hypothetical protein DSL92_01940 [Billgrantia gudaonensis]|uniref:Uncharacterized protein n=1 Tax=Billgrantia gudaonensis TaxID=376427 RepID=A0A432JKC1_9GAMM|nr:hypothetical protein DSL92_01940 [Halomonas gudaonensis]
MFTTHHLRPARHQAGGDLSRSRPPPCSGTQCRPRRREYRLRVAAAELTPAVFARHPGRKSGEGHYAAPTSASIPMAQPGALPCGGERHRVAAMRREPLLGRPKGRAGHCTSGR